MPKLVITEKPSVAQSIAKVLSATKRCNGYLEGNGYLVSWCVGHLVELAPPDHYDERYKKWKKEDLPILPANWRYTVSSGTKKQFNILKELMNRDDVDSLICATDAGREGELIFRLVYHQCRCRKPFERLWISSMEDSAIRDGFRHLKPGTEYDALYKAALCRERSDWIVGINATRLFSVLYGNTLNVGRVMSPTLALTVMREAAIAAFISEPFYTVKIQMDGFTASSERIKLKGEAEKLAADCKEASAAVTKVERKNRKEKPPLLYDLTTLQREANKIMGYTAQQTLDYTQSLYEKKMVTYPRTDSRYLTEDMAAMIPDLVQKTAKKFSFSDEAVPVQAGQVINNKKVTDHHAIIPTKTAAETDLSALPAGEQAVLELIARRLVCAVGIPCESDETAVELSCAGSVFKAKGSIVTEPGWKAFISGTESGKEDKEEDASSIPDVQNGIELTVREAVCKEGKTVPPKHYTEATLLQAMENADAEEMPEDAERKGLGTPATRAGIIEKLVRTGFLERTGNKKTKYLIPTQKGTALVTILPEQIQSASMTAEWEEKLLEIERGKYSGDAFMGEIEAMISDLVKNYQIVPDAEILMQKQKSQEIGKCPVCGNDVIEGAKGWFCANRSCPFALWKQNRYFDSIGKKLTVSVAEKLLANGKVRMKGCKSAKTGKTFDVVLILEIDADGKARFRLDFEGGKK